jgi:hypothetical protein
MSQGDNHKLIQLLHQLANHRVIYKLPNIINSSNTSKSLFSICYSKSCSNVATMTIKLPINEKLACIINVCKECIPKFCPEYSNNRVESENALANKYTNLPKVRTRADNISTCHICRSLVSDICSIMKPNEAEWFQRCTAEIEQYNGHAILERFLRMYKNSFNGSEINR